jgi:hypothetical protein
MPSAVEQLCSLQERGGCRYIKYMASFISMLIIVMLGWLFMAPLIIAPCWQLCRRWGYAPTLSLLLLIPYVGFVALVLLLQNPRPRQDELDTTRRP